MELKRLLAGAKRKWYVLAVSVLLLTLVYLQFGRDVKVNSTTRNSAENRTEERLVIIANRLYINKEKFAQEMLQRRIDDSFKDVMFMGKFSDRIEMEVYKNPWAWKMNKIAFVILYERDYAGKYKCKIR